MAAVVAAAVLVVVAALVMVVVLALPGAQPVAGQAVAAETISIGGAPVAVRHIGPATVTTADDDAAVGGVLADLQTYWTSVLPVDFGRSFTPLAGGYVSIDSTAATGTGPCVARPALIAGNAYYCPGADAIVYDSAALVPVLLGAYGVAGLTASFAHEFGHAIQARIGPTTTERAASPARYPNLLIEAQGDCYAGSFLAWAVAGSGTHIRLPASSMVRAVAPLLDFRDRETVPVGDATAHGLGLDRLTSLLRGFRDGPPACHQLARTDLRPTLGRTGVLAGGSTPRYASTNAVVAAGRTSVAAFAAALPAGVTTGLSASALTAARASAADLAAAEPFGQFAGAAALALAVGRSLTGSATGAACFTGAWTASVFGHAARGALGSWAGDADEALDMLRARPAATFAELAGYADGFAGGWAACRA